jgi:excisionase family DNA binding protein
MSIASCGLGRDNPPTRIFYAPREAEAILGISHATLYRLIAAKRLDARKLGNKTLITAESILRLASELPSA